MAIGFNLVKCFSYLEQSNTFFPSILQFSLIGQDDTEFLMTSSNFIPIMRNLVFFSLDYHF